VTWPSFWPAGREPVPARAGEGDEMTFGSLFAGIGGFDLGFEQAGLTCSWQVEINEFCRKVLAKHWPTVRRHDDVRTFTDGRDPAEWSVDVIAGGFPCKQTSTAAAVHGRRVGLAGKDSGLWANMLAIVRWIEPRFVVVENPPSEWLAEVSRGLAGAGYRVSRVPVSADGVGAPHLRRRMFLVADHHRTGLPESWATGPSAAECGPRGADHRDTWLSSLPGVLRVDDGIPGGLDRRERIQAVGNSIVPLCAEIIGRRLAFMK
jgi:DNA (cytosine-5)-methyltransferase 1